MAVCELRRSCFSDINRLNGVDGEKTLQGVAALAYQQTFRCNAFSV